MAVGAGGLLGQSRLTLAAPGAARVTVGAHPWVYAATQPNYDITPILPRIFGYTRSISARHCASISGVTG